MMISLLLALGLLTPAAPAGSVAPSGTSDEPDRGEVDEAEAARSSGAAEAVAEPESRSEGEVDEAEEPLPELEELPALPELDELPKLDALPELDTLPELDALPEADTTASTGNAAAARPSNEESLDVRDVLTGSLRLVGAFLHFDDIPALYPAGDDALFATVARVMVDRTWHERYSLELNYFADITRSPGIGASAGVGGAFGTAGSTDSVYRSPFLSWTLWEDGSVRGGAGVDRFAFGAKLGPVSLRVGRFPITHTVTSFFTPNDFLAPFSVTAVNRIYKPGVDAIQVGTSLGMIGSVEVSGVMGNDDEGDPSWGRSAILARASVLGGGFEWAALGGKVAERWVVGGSFQGSIEALGIHGEAHVGFPDVDGDGRGAEDEDRPVHVRLATGPTLNVGWNGLALGAEYAFYSDGATRPEDLIARAGRLFPDDVPLLARHYVGANAGLELTPLLRTSVLTMIDANDGSGLAGLSLAYSVADEADLLLGAFVPWGADPSIAGDPMMPVLALGSELGASPLAVYLEARTFF